MKYLLEIRNLTKRYGNLLAVDELTLNVPKKSVFGILGPNGSGKTTTLSIILGAVFQDSGDFKWNIGHELKENEVRKKIGSLLEKPNFLPYLSAVNNLKMIAKIKEVSEELIEDALKAVGLYERRNSHFKTYSLGMKQRLAIASVLLSEPEVLVLDEPANGLDPQGIVEIRELIKKLSLEGKTIIIASHILDEVEKVCTDVAILKQGVLKEIYEIGSNKNDYSYFEIGSDDMDTLESFLKAQPGIQEILNKGDFFMVQAVTDISIGELSKKLSDVGIFPNHLQKSKKSLESVFLSATGGEK